jgi:catalase
MRRPQKDSSNEATRYQDDDRRRRPVESDEFSPTVGPEGPVLLQDHYLIEQMANFSRGAHPRAPAARQGRRRVRPHKGP